MPRILDQYYTPEHVADRLQVPVETIRALVHSNRLEATDITPNVVRISERSVVAHLRAQTRVTRRTTRIWKTAMASFVALASLCTTGLLLAQDSTPQQSATVPYEAYLEQDGLPIDGTRQLTFTLFDSDESTTPLWSETIPATIVGGHFSTALGQVTPLDEVLSKSRSLYLEVTVAEEDSEGSQLLAGRQLLGSVPFARRAAPGSDFAVDGIVTSSAFESGHAKVTGETETNTLRANTAVVAGNVSVGATITANTFATASQSTVSANSMSVPGLWVPIARGVAAQPGEVTVADIPPGYRFLKFVFKLATTVASGRALYFQVNDDSSTSYNAQFTNNWDRAIVVSANRTTQGTMAIACPNPGSPYWSVGEVIVNNVPGESIHQFSGYATCHLPDVVLYGGQTFSSWMSNEEIRSIRLYSDPAGGLSTSLAAGSELTVLGMR